MRRLLADISGPFYTTTKPFRNWSSFPFDQIDLPFPPYVDMQQLTWGIRRALLYLERLSNQGYTGIVVDNLAHLTTFEQAPRAFFPHNTACRLRARAYAEAFQVLFEQAAAYGMEVFVTTDMQWATPDLRSFVASIEPDNPCLLQANRWAIDELFCRFPQISGLVVRVGETGGAHNLGGEYTGHLIYRSVSELRSLVDGLLPICEQQHRLLVIRTWSIGIGELGDLMWSPERYRDVFGSYHSPNLLVSIKHGPSDFFRYLPINPTLGLPGPKQIIELQNRREYELFGMVPAAVIEEQRKIAQKVAGDSTITGVWAWNSTGGWGGGTAVLGSSGWSLWTELNSAVTAALSQDATCCLEAFVYAWCMQRFGGQHQEFAHIVAQLYLASEHLFMTGWYLCTQEKQAASLGRMYLPTLLWIWWMRPTASPLIWAYLAVSQSDYQQCIDAGAAALTTLDSYLLQLHACHTADLPEADFVLTSTRYLRDCMRVAYALRSLFLPLAQAALVADYTEWKTLVGQSKHTLQILDQHRDTWGTRSDFVALELAELYRYIEGLHSHPKRAWHAARVAARIVHKIGHVQQLPAPSRPMLAILSLGVLLLWPKLGLHKIVVGSLLTLRLSRRLRQPITRWLLPRLSRRFFLLPSIFFETGPALDEWAE